MPWPNFSTSTLLAVRPVLNARGIYTDLGGSRLSPAVWARASVSSLMDCRPRLCNVTTSSG